MTRIALPLDIVSPICALVGVGVGGVYVTARAISQWGAFGGALGLLLTAAALALVVQLLPHARSKKTEATQA